MTHTNETLISDENVDIQNVFIKDGSFEHLWERLWINVCMNIGGKYKIIKNNEIFEKNESKL